MPYITVEEEVWVDLDDFETEDLVEDVMVLDPVSSLDRMLIC